MNEIKIKEISDKIKDFGVISINNFLDVDKFDSANNICDKIRTKAIQKGDKKKDYPVFLKNIFITKLSNSVVAAKVVAFDEL